MARVSPMQAEAKLQEQIGGMSDHKVQHVRSVNALQLAGAVFNWCMWLSIMVLMLSQVLTTVFNTSTSQANVRYGQEVAQGLYRIPGTNDEPYSDRVVVCVRRERHFKAVSLNEALDSSSAIVEDATDSAIHGYRAVHRTACADLGYTNLTHDSLRVMDGDTLKNIPNALPFLLMPYWDDGPTARSVIPAWDGHACVFRLHGQYEDPTRPKKYLAGVNRAVRETQTIAWPDRPGGQWKNGWYEDTHGMRWYSDILAMGPDNSDGLVPRYFDPSLGQELTAELASVLRMTAETSIEISNGTRFGFFFYGSEGVNVVTCVYDFSALISNASVSLLLCRWMVAMLALHRGYSKRVSTWHSAGLGSIAQYLTIAMVPRMKMILAAFYTVGCDFEGPHKALADAWFVMYPSIVDLVLVYASVLNMAAKLFHRRLSDWVIGQDQQEVP